MEKVIDVKARRTKLFNSSLFEEVKIKASILSVANGITIATIPVQVTNIPYSELEYSREIIGVAAMEISCAIKVPDIN